MKFSRLGYERRTNKWEVSAIPFVSNFAGLDSLSFIRWLASKSFPFILRKKNKIKFEEILLDF